MMQKRRSHAKSRRGCQNCKKRHVKCDELGPPCAACIARDTTSTCTYSTSRPLEAPRVEISATNSTDSPSEKWTTEEYDNESQPRRLLELELMHRWTTITYKSMCSSDSDADYLQIAIPRAALKYDFLLYSLCSFSALDLAICDVSRTVDKQEFDRLIHAALKYFDLSSRSLRGHLDSISPESQHCMYMCSMVLAAAWTVMPPEDENQQPTMVDRMDVLFDLLLGCSEMVTINQTWLWESPLSGSLQAAAAKLIEDASVPLEDTATAALACLTSIIATDVSTLAPVTGQDLQSSPQAQSQDIYKKAEELLHLCFVTKSIQGMCIAVPMFSGHRFALAFKSRDPKALYIMMYWAVILDQLGEKVWWARSVGRELVYELADLLRSELRFASMPEWGEGIAWAKEKVGSQRE